MKKIISFLLTLILLTGSFSVFAKTDKTKDVLMLVKSKIGSTEEYEEFQSSVTSNSNGSFYNFRWETASDKKPWKSLSVTATESGIITNYNFYSDDDERNQNKPALMDMTVSEALEKAKSHVERLNPDLKDEIIVLEEDEYQTQSLYDSGFYFRIERQKDGVPVYNNDGSIYIDKTGEIIRTFRLNYDENISFISKDSAMTLGEAKDTFKDKIGMKLIYSADFDYKTKERRIIPVYVPVTSSKYINAVTGETEEFIYSAYPEDGNLKNESSAMGSLREDLSNAENKEFENIDSLKSKDELIQIIKENKYIGISDNMNLTNYRTSKNVYDNEYILNASFDNGQDENYRYISVSLNMETGEIMSFYKSGKEVYSNEKLSENEINAIKETAIKDLAKEKFSEYKEEDGRYIRYINGVPYENDSLNLNVNKYTGEITSYNISYTNTEFPVVTNVISKLDACDTLFENVSYDLYYAKMKNTDKEFKLIYILDTNIPHRVDAFSKKLLNYGNDEQEARLTDYTDIDGHYAKDAINELKKYGIGFYGSEFKPGEPVLQKDYVALLVSVFKRGNAVILKEDKSFENEYNDALREEIIFESEKNPTEKITREKAAKYMVRAMGIDEYASISGIYVTPFSDVKDSIGHIAILSGLGIIKGNGQGQFNPDSTLTRADAILLIYNYLKR